MNSSGYGKVLAAFAAGLVLALGGAALYVKVAHRVTPGDNGASVSSSQSTTTQAAAQVTPDKLPDAGGSQPPPAVEPVATPVPTADPVTEAPVAASPKMESARPLPPPKAARKVKPQQHEEKPSQVTSQPRLLAQNTPPPAPREYYPAPPPDDPAPSQTPAASPAPAQDAGTPISASAAATPVAPPVTPPAPAREPRTVTIQSGTKLVVRLNQEISSDRAVSGDTFVGTLESPVVLNNALIAEKGSSVRGKIVTAQKGSRGGGSSSLTLVLTNINTTDGQQVGVETSYYQQQGPSSTRQNMEKVGGGAALGAIIGAIAGGGKGAAIGAGAGGAAGGGSVLLTHAKPAVLQSETKLDFELTRPVVITERLK